MTRWRASGIHLLFSLAIAAIAGVLLFLLWYPGTLFNASGGDRLIMLLVGIDIVIGPLLTLIVFRSGKPGMRFDLSVIATVQFAALVYGLMVILEARPVFLVQAVDRFVAVSANQLDDADLAQASLPRYRTRSWFGPVRVTAIPPADATEREALLFSALQGKDIERFPRYYRSYDAAQAGARARPYAELAARAPERAKALARLASEHGGAEALGWLPLVARNYDLTAVLRRVDGEIVAMLPIDPW